MTLLKAIEFASIKHRDQRRKDATQAPYINHCIRVAAILEEVGGIDNQEQLIAAVLHDTLEDTDTTEKELEEHFGLHVRALIEAMSDDKSLPKQLRKDLQVEHVPHVPEDVAVLKLADKIANCEDLLVSAPVEWSQGRIYEYFSWAKKVLANLPYVNKALYERASQVIDEGLKRYATKGRLIVYGDVHGCLEELKTLREKVAPKKEDREVIIGDILDKGPYCVETLQYAREKGIESVMGNHEYKYLRYYKHEQNREKTGKKNPMSFGPEKTALYKALHVKDLAYIETMPFYIKVGNVTLLHAGITNDINLETAKKRKLESVIYIRDLDENGKWLSRDLSSQAHRFWAEVYDGNQGFVVYGHSDFEEVRIDPYAIGIDTGCVYGNKLTALIINDTQHPLESYEIVDEKTRRV